MSQEKINTAKYEAEEKIEESSPEMITKELFNATTRERALNKLKTFGAGEYSVFLENFAEQKEKHNLSQETISDIVERGLELAKQLPETEAEFFAFKLSCAFQPHGDFERDPEKPERISSIDKAFLSLKELYYKYPDQVDRVWQGLGQNAQTIRPDILIKGLKELMWRPDVSLYFKMDSVASLNYLMSFYDVYNEAFEESLSLLNVKNFSETGRWIDFISSLRKYSEVWSFSKKMAYSGKFEKYLKNILEETKGNYALHLYAENALSIMKYEKSKLEEVKQGNLFKNKKGIWCEAYPDMITFYEDEKLIAYKEPESNQIKEIEEIDKLDKERANFFKSIEDLKEIQTSITDAGFYSDIAPGIRGYYTYRGELMYIKRTEENKIQPPGLDFIIHSTENIPAEELDRRLQQLQDFLFITKEPLRQKIEKEFDINLSQFDLPTQAWFLDYLKNKSLKDIKALKDFIKGFGSDGLHTFVVEEYGAEYGDRVMLLGEKLEKKQALELFREYSMIIGAANQFSRAFEGIESNGQILSEQIFDAILRRSKDILNTAYLLADKKEAGAVFAGQKILVNSMDEVMSALSNYRKSLEIISALVGAKDQSDHQIKHIKDIEHNVKYRETGFGPTKQGNVMKSSHFRIEGFKDKEGEVVHLIVQSRLYGAPIGAHNEKLEFDGEARINFVLVFDPQNPGWIDENIENRERRSAISLRIDREGKKFDKKGEMIPELNDPTRRDGNISLEIGAFATSDEVENKNTILGRVIAVGNYYATHHDALEKGRGPQYYHNRASFSKSFGDAEKFAEIVEKFRENLKREYTRKHRAAA